ncbi:hypothetical protein RJT34_31162 [Clitoria ternatea]|uniref:Transmembrane protein n=1 Tax=Clitoria ternatea TaxID=43366 RepID=A0AAN9EVW0_CLITE
MNKVIRLLVLLLLAQIIVVLVEAKMINGSEAQAPLPVLNPSEHKTQTWVQLHNKNTGHKVEDRPVSGAAESSSEGEESKEAEAPQSRRLGKHHSTDKSVAGGGVIIGGLVTAIFAAIFCYIRVTRRRDPRY